MSETLTPEQRKAALTDAFAKLGNSNNEVQTQGEKAKKPKARFWVNVGVEMNGVLVSLPMGIALDDLKSRPLVPNSDNKEFRHLREAEADLWNQMKKLMELMEDGDEHVLSQFQVRIRKTQPKERDESETNPLLVGKLAF